MNSTRKACLVGGIGSPGCGCVPDPRGGMPGVRRFPVPLVTRQQISIPAQLDAPAQALKPG